MRAINRAMSNRVGSTAARRLACGNERAARFIKGTTGMTSSVNSLPMYFPAAPFSLADAVTCAALVASAYDQYTQWVNQGSPAGGAFIWTPASTTIDYTYSGPLFWNYPKDEFWEINEPFGFIAQATASGDTFLVLRGSQSDADYYQDVVQYQQTPYNFVANYGSVHMGFYQIYKSLSPQIQQALAGFHNVKRFFFTGHSLGSGLSTLAVPDVITNTKLQPSRSLPVLHYNFASPRVGDPVFAGQINGGAVPTFRIVNTEDIVPIALPPIIPALSPYSGALYYQHVGTPVDFTANYGSVAGNHSLTGAYSYALNNPLDPESGAPLPSRGFVRQADVAP
jgi:hypothetical protein